MTGLCLPVQILRYAQDDNEQETGQEAEKETEKAPLYRVQAGAYMIKGNAEAMKDRLRKAGIEAVIIQI